MPIVTKKRRVDQDSRNRSDGWRFVDAFYLLFSVSYINSLLMFFFQTGTSYFQTTSTNRILLCSSLCKWHMHRSRAGRVYLRHLSWAHQNCYLALLHLLPRKENSIRVMIMTAMKMGSPPENVYNNLEGGGNNEDVSSSEDQDEDWGIEFVYFTHQGGGCPILLLPSALLPWSGSGRVVDALTWTRFNTQVIFTCGWTRSCPPSTAQRC